jgi:hypothetical protein
MQLRPIDQAVADLRAMSDPLARIREADSLDSALAEARAVVAQIKREAVTSLRTASTGYGTIAQQLGISKARVQQIANAPGKVVLAAYAFLDESGQLYGDSTTGMGPLTEAPTAAPFTPGDKYNPLMGQTLLVLYGPVADDGSVSLYTLHLRGEQGRPLVVRMTHQVQHALFGPPVSGTPARAQWEAARERRRRELGAD